MKEGEATEGAGRDVCGNGQELQTVVEAFGRWRAGRKMGERIPQQLWQAAVSVYPRHSVHRIARALRLDSGDLRNRCAGVKASRTRGRQARGPQFMPIAVTPAIGDGGVVDCRVWVREGRKIRIQLKVNGAGTGSVIELLRELWRSGS